MVPESAFELARLLSELATRVDGAIDFWTCLCFVPDEEGGMTPGFLEDNRAVLSKLVNDVDQIAIHEVKHIGSLLHEHASTLSRNVTSLCESFCILRNHRQCGDAEANLAIAWMSECHRSILRIIQMISSAYGIEINYMQNRTPEREAYYNGILGRLPQLVAESRRHGTVPQSLQMSAPDFQEIENALAKADKPPIDTQH